MLESTRPVDALAADGRRHAQLEAPGLFYSYATADTQRPGRVAFVPWALLPTRP